MRILLLGTDPSRHDGWTTYQKTLSEGLSARGHDVRVLPLQEPLTFFTNPFVAPLRSLRVRKEIHAFNPDILHVTGEPFSMLLPWLGKNIARKSVVTLHGSYGVRMFHGFFTRRRTAWNICNCAAFVAVSAYTKARVLEEAGTLSGLLGGKLFMVYTGINAQPASCMPHTGKNIITVGAVKPRKGTLEAIEGFHAYLQKSGTGAHFTIVGRFSENDSYVQKLHERMAQLGIGDNVTLVGEVTEGELERQYQSADVFLLPAKTTHDTFEGFGLVFLEAALRGIPCIGPDDGGAMEAIDHGVSGYRVRPTDAQAMAGALMNILDERRVNSAACVAWAKRFSVDAMIDGMEKMYARVTSIS